MKKSVLIVDDEDGVRESLKLVLRDRYQLTGAASGEEALAILSQEKPDVVLLDIVMPGVDGLEVLQRIRSLDPRIQVVMLTATKTIKTAVAAMKNGAFDYITKPFDIEELRLVVERASEKADMTLEIERLRTEVERRYGFENLIGRSKPMQEVLKTVTIVAPQKATILITGESGTGKELIAKAIHFNSPRRHKPLVVVNCAAIPETLLESELFGHERGAFTDAHTRKAGRFELAHSGTLFLDEIGEMSRVTQTKILRVIEQSEFNRIGGTESIRADVRLIAATNRNLEAALSDGSFRSDLYYRLNVISIHLPPLRERHEDIPFLIDYFLHTKREETGVGEKFFTGEAIDLLLRHPWPGNVRELENAVERALILSPGPAMGPQDLPDYIRDGRQQVALPIQREVLAGLKPLGAAVDNFERELILTTLMKTNFNQTKAAELLGTTRRILRYKMEKLNIDSGSEDL